MSMTIRLWTRTRFLDKAIGAVAPIHGISVRRDLPPIADEDGFTAPLMFSLPDVGLHVRIDFKDEATPEQRAAAEQALFTFDWSDEAQATREGR